MNELAAREAVRDWIQTNASIFVSGLTRQGAAMALNQVTRSLFTRPQQYPYIVVHCTRAWTEDIGSASRYTKSYYDMVIEINDFAFPQEGEEHVYEEMDGAMRTLSDRMVNALFSLTRDKICSDGVCFQLYLEGGAGIDKRNNDTALTDQEMSVVGLILGAEITFTIMEC